MKGLYPKYFVVKPKGSDTQAKASRAALLAYAGAVKEENPALYQDLMYWVRHETSEALAELLRKSE